MFFHKVSNRKALRKFKKRRCTGVNMRTLKHVMTTFIYHQKGGLVEMRLHKLLLRKFRRRAKRRKFKVKFFFVPNYSFSKKSVNSRMGKGKGKVKRLLASLPAYKPIASLRGISFQRVIKFVRRIWKAANIKLICSKAPTKNTK